MCTLVILYRPGHAWPVLMAANRDEMLDRPWQPPGHHWPERPGVVAGIDALAGGSWLGLNEEGLAAGVLNRPGSLGPERGKRSRGGLVLEALDHTQASEAARALGRLDGRAYRSFNLVVADKAEAFCLVSDGLGRVMARPVPPGLSMVTDHDLNSPDSPRIRFYLPRFRRTGPPRPEAGDWSSWIELLSSREAPAGSGPVGAMRIETETGFGTVNASLLALPAQGKPVWLFASGAPGEAPFEPVGV